MREKDVQKHVYVVNIVQIQPARWWNFSKRWRNFLRCWRTDSETLVNWQRAHWRNDRWRTNHWRNDRIFYRSGVRSQIWIFLLSEWNWQALIFFFWQKLQTCSNAFPDQNDTRNLQMARDTFESRWKRICRNVSHRLRQTQDRIALCREFNEDYKQFSTWLRSFENKVSIPCGRCEDLQELSLEIARLQVRSFSHTVFASKYRVFFRVWAS